MSATDFSKISKHSLILTNTLFCFEGYRNTRSNMVFSTIFNIKIFEKFQKIIKILGFTRF